MPKISSQDLTDCVPEQLDLWAALKHASVFWSQMSAWLPAGLLHGMEMSTPDSWVIKKRKTSEFFHICELVDVCCLLYILCHASSEILQFSSVSYLTFTNPCKQVGTNKAHWHFKVQQHRSCIGEYTYEYQANRCYSIVCFGLDELCVCPPCTSGGVSGWRRCQQAGGSPP